MKSQYCLSLSETTEKNTHVPFLCLVLCLVSLDRLHPETPLFIKQVHQVTAGKAGTVQY